MKSWKVALKTIVSAALVYWLIRRVEWQMVGAIVTHASLPLVLAYISLQFAGNIISSVKWRYLARTQGFIFSVKDGVVAYLTGAFINNFLPSTIGGDTYRVLWMSRIGERSRAFAVVFFDRITGLLVLFLFAGIGLFILPWGVLVKHPPFLIFAAITISVVFVMLLALLWAERFYQFALFLAALLPWKRPMFLLQDFESLAHAKVYTVTVLWASLFTLVGIGMSNFYLFSSLGATLSPLVFASVIFAATLVANIPISVNNIGVKEWSYVFFFGLVGVSAELAVTAALASRLLQMLISFTALPGYLSERKRLD
jgi:uncharacterized membrane protein YbhN (UPF0104 family)